MTAPFNPNSAAILVPPTYTPAFIPSRSMVTNGLITCYMYNFLRRITVRENAMNHAMGFLCYFTSAFLVL